MFLAPTDICSATPQARVRNFLDWFAAGNGGAPPVPRLNLLDVRLWRVFFTDVTGTR